MTMVPVPSLSSEPVRSPASGAKPAIRVEGLGKKYVIRHQSEGRYQTLRNALSGAVRRAGHLLVNRLRGLLAPPSPRWEEFWALRDVSFEVQPGEVVGIVGRNGAGKSTLLKLLSRITAPSCGRIRTRGRIASLLEVGTGFHPELTGRENISLNGAILGMSRKETARRFDEIVDFAGIEKFLDMPVKYYSSGMYMRLAFSVAAHLEPDILVIDEVLAVGDLQFQKKCLDRMDHVSKSGRTILFVSHNMQAVRSLCQRCLLLSDGKLIREESPSEIIAEYYRLNGNIGLTPSTAVHDSRLRRGSGEARFTTVEVKDCEGRVRNEFLMGEPVRFHIRYHCYQPVRNLYFAIIFKSIVQDIQVSCIRTPLSRFAVPAGTLGEAVVELPSAPFRPGEYPMMYWLGDEHTVPYDALDTLLNPLIITTDRTFQQLGFDPARESGFFNVDFVVKQNTLCTTQKSCRP